MRKRTSKIWSALSAVAMVSCLFPATAFAEDSEIFVNGIKVTEENKSDVLGEADGDANTVSYDFDTNTLTLSNATLTGAGAPNTQGLYLSGVEDTVVKLVGENIITGYQSGFNANVSGSTKPSVTFTGTGSLEVNNCTYMSQGGLSSITVDGIVLKGNNMNGIVCDQDFIVKNGAYVDLTVGEDDSNLWNPVYANGNIEIYDSTLISNSGATGGIWAVGFYDDAQMKFVRSSVTLNGTGWGAMAGSGNNGNDTLYIEDSTITVNSPAGILATKSATLKGDVKILSPSNRQLVRTISDVITCDLDDESEIQGYLNEKNATIYFATDYTLTEDFKLPDGINLSILEGVTLTLTDGVKIIKGENATITNNGTVSVPCDSDEVDVDYGNPLSTKHEGGTASCTEQAVCANCGQPYGDMLPHTYSTDWKSDKENHWHECEVCKDQKDMADHTPITINVKEETTTENGYSGDNICEVCGYVIKKGVEIPMKTVPTASDNNNQSKAPKTGDNNNIALWYSLLIVSALGLAGNAVLSKKRKANK